MTSVSPSTSPPHISVCRLEHSEPPYELSFYPLTPSTGLWSSAEKALFFRECPPQPHVQKTVITPPRFCTTDTLLRTKNPRSSLRLKTSMLRADVPWSQRGR